MSDKKNTTEAGLMLGALMFPKIATAVAISCLLSPELRNAAFVAYTKYSQDAKREENVAKMKKRLRELPRRKIQEYAKRCGVKATSTTSDLIEQIVARVYNLPLCKMHYRKDVRS